MTLAVVKQSEADLAAWIATEAGFIEGLCRYDEEPIVLEAYQRAFMQNRSRFRWITKGRQIGYSFVFALEALARCHLRDGHTAVFVSYNLEDAKEKILIARQVFDELPLAFSVDVASSSDMNNLLPLVENLKQQHPEIHQHAEECSADKGYDSAANNASLFDLHDIKPIIDTRKLWKDKTRETLFPKRYDVFTYDEQGRVYCTCPSDQRGKTETRELAFAGFEKARNTLKYRCPAAAYGLNCSGRKECESLAPGGVGDFGRVVRVPLETNRRIFTPVARHTFKWKKSYKKRTAVERVNGQIDRVPKSEQHTIRGKQKMTMQKSLALIVLLAMALGRIQIGQKEQMRSILKPIAPAA